MFYQLNNTILLAVLCNTAQHPQGSKYDSSRSYFLKRPRSNLIRTNRYLGNWQIIFEHKYVFSLALIGNMSSETKTLRSRRDICGKDRVLPWRRPKLGWGRGKEHLERRH